MKTDFGKLLDPLWNDFVDNPMRDRLTEYYVTRRIARELKDYIRDSVKDQLDLVWDDLANRVREENE